MKRKYIKPEADFVTCALISMIAASKDPDNEWDTQIGDGGKEEDVGGNEPSPGDEAKTYDLDLWE